MNKNIKINGMKYQNVSKIKVQDAETSDLHEFRNTDDATVSSFDILIGKVGYGKDGIVHGAYVPPSTVGSGETDYKGDGINFYDAHGQKIASYQLTDLPLSALPEIPALDGAGADGYTFAWIKTLDEVNALTEPRDIAVDVTATTNKTYLIPNEKGITAKSHYLRFYGNETTATTINIDWGDGTVDTNKTITAAKTAAFSHSYTAVSHNPIVIEWVSGGEFYVGSNGATGTSYQNVTLLGGYYHSMNNGKPQYPDYLHECIGEVRIGKGIKGISNIAFYLTAVEKYILPNTLTFIGTTYALSDMNKKSICIPKSIVSTGSISLGGKRMENIVICDGFTGGISISDSPLLSHITIPEGAELRYAGSCFNLKRIKLPNGTTKIYSSMCSSDHTLTSVEIPDSVITIDQNAFSCCSSLQGIKLPDGLTTLGQSAFNGCYNLRSIEIPEGVTSLAPNIFQNCEALEYIKLKASTPPTLSGSLEYVNIKYNCKILVPTGSLSAYATATNWTASALRMEEY